jgi:nucleoside-diphosphate-sugar epimerase
MANMPWSEYGNLKKLGEHFTKSLGGVSVRLWNVYGPEPVGEKSHVITDFIKKARETGRIDMITDGTEVRQLLHVEDCSKVMHVLAQNYDLAKTYGRFDVTNFVWTEINRVAEIIAEHYGAEVVRSEAKDSVQRNSRFEPNRHPIEVFWNPDETISIEEGIIKMIEHYEAKND